MDVLRILRAMGRSDPMQFWRDMHAVHGDTIALNLGLLKIWFFASPEAIYEIFVTQNRTMRKGIGYSGLRKLLGEGLITNDRDNWGTQRQRLNPVFSPGAINNYAGSVHDACEAGMAELRTLAQAGKPVDFGHAMTRLTMRIISLAAFGVDLTHQIVRGVALDVEIDHQGAIPHCGGDGCKVAGDTGLAYPTFLIEYDALHKLLTQRD